MIEGPHVKAFREKQEGQHISDWTELLRHPWGRRLLSHVIGDPRYCGADRSTHNADQRETDRLNGMRDVGLTLRKTAQEIDFEMYDRMLGEAANESRAFLMAQRSDSEPKEK